MSRLLFIHKFQTCSIVFLAECTHWYKRKNILYSFGYNGPYSERTSKNTAGENSVLGKKKVKNRYTRTTPLYNMAVLWQTRIGLWIRDNASAESDRLIYKIFFIRLICFLQIILFQIKTNGLNRIKIIKVISKI